MAVAAKANAQEALFTADGRVETAKLRMLSRISAKPGSPPFPNSLSLALAVSAQAPTRSPQRAFPRRCISRPGSSSSTSLPRCRREIERPGGVSEGGEEIHTVQGSSDRNLPERGREANPGRELDCAYSGV